MKVCLLNDSFPPVIDGVANVVMNYAKIMQEEGLADIAVGTPKYPGADYNVYPYYVVPYHSVDTTKIVKGYRAGNPIDLGEIRDLIEFSPDIIHSHCPFSSTVLARIIRAQTTAPLIFTYHTKFDVDIAKAVKMKFLQKETIKNIVSNIEACDDVWVVSKGAGENLKSLGYQGEYRVVNNGVDFAKGRVDELTVQKVTKDYDLPSDIPVYLFVGRIVKYKGIPIILDALKILFEQNQDFRMVFIGSGPDEMELKEKAREYGFYDNSDKSKNKCIFTGPIRDRNILRAWNTRANLFLFPSTYDTNGIVVREAAACGLCSVLIKDSCAAEGITDGQNGYLIEENADSMASLLKTLGNDINRMNETGINAMNEIYISWQDSVHEAYDRYQEVLELKKTGIYVRKSQVISQHVKSINDDFVEDMWEDFKEDTSRIKDNSKRFFDNMLDNVEEFGESLSFNILTGFDDMCTSLMGNISDIKDLKDDVKEDIKEDIKSAISKIKKI